MDKKKVKELIQEAIIWSKQANQHSVVSNLEEALKELSKSDWVSVEDGLPEYGEFVNVRMESIFDTCYCSSQRVKSMEQSKYLDYDKNNFQVLSCVFHITHWKPIEKLED